jgi:hypothetical protein
MYPAVEFVPATVALHTFTAMHKSANDNQIWEIEIAINFLYRVSLVIIIRM